MANKIQNFDTGEKDNSNIIHLDLDPKINIENKIYFKNLLNKIAECSIEDLEDNLENLYHVDAELNGCLLYTSPSPRDKRQSRMPSSA